MIVLLTRLAVLCVVASTLATAGALGARLNWFLELFSHFPEQYLILLALGGTVSVAFRRWGWVLVAMIVAVPNVLVVAPYLPGFRPAPVADVAAAPVTVPVVQYPVRLVAANLLYRQEDPAAALTYFAQQSADILVLSEFTPRWREKLRDLERTYPYFALRPRFNPWGIAVYSKHPFRAIEDLDLGDAQSSHLRLLVELPDGLAELYAVHLASPPREGRAGQRNTQLRKLAALIAAADPALPKIVAGDFNLTPFSPYFGDLLRDAGLRDGGQPFGLQRTWPVWVLPLAIPIDHCLVGGAVDVTRVAAGPPIGSDHFPLECTFSLSS